MDAGQLLAKAGIDGSKRAEELKIEQFVVLANAAMQMLKP